MTIAEKILSFNNSLSIKANLPDDVDVLFPFNSELVKNATAKFYNKYYNDEKERIVLLGINPGRFGAGVTGIPFTDPIRLEQECGIDNEFAKKPELSAEFIYKIIGEFGGPKKFYSKYLISSLCPLGFTRNGKNLNYYDDKKLEKSLDGFIVDTLEQQINFGLNTKICFCLGEGKNYKYFTKLNQEHNFFEEIIPLAHPRYIMQYKRKKLDGYILAYIEKLDIY